jgi:hypothetical protein
MNIKLGTNGKVLGLPKPRDIKYTIYTAQIFTATKERLNEAEG